MIVAISRQLRMDLAVYLPKKNAYKFGFKGIDSEGNDERLEFLFHLDDLVALKKIMNKAEVLNQEKKIGELYGDIGSSEKESDAK